MNNLWFKRLQLRCLVHVDQIVKKNSDFHHRFDVLIFRKRLVVN